MRTKQLFILAWMLVIPSLGFADERNNCGERCPLTSVPEPETLALLGVGAVALFIARRRNKK